MGGGKANTRSPTPAPGTTRVELALLLDAPPGGPGGAVKIQEAAELATSNSVGNAEPGGGGGGGRLGPAVFITGGTRDGLEDTDPCWEAVSDRTSENSVWVPNLAPENDMTALGPAEEDADAITDAFVAAARPRKPAIISSALVCS